MLPAPIGDPREVDVVDAAAGDDAPADLRHGLGSLLGVHVGVVDEGRAEEQRLERAEARERPRLVRSHVAAPRHARRVGRREPHVLRHSAGHGEDRVGVHVHEAGRDDAPRAVDAAARAESGRGARRARHDRQAVAADPDDGVLDHRAGGIARERDATPQEQIEAGRRPRGRHATRRRRSRVRENHASTEIKA